MKLFQLWLIGLTHRDSSAAVPLLANPQRQGSALEGSEKIGFLASSRATAAEPFLFCLCFLGFVCVNTTGGEGREEV